MLRLQTEVKHASSDERIAPPGTGLGTHVAYYLLVQGIYHFEWAMDCAGQHGLLSPSHPVLCKPFPKVCCW